MPFLLFCALLITTTAFATEKRIPLEGTTAIQSSEFRMIPASACLKSDATKKLCDDGFVPEQFNGRALEVIDASKGRVALTVSNSNADDQYELLCYRCSFSKTSVERCGPYKDTHGDKSWAANCPKSKSK